MDKPAPGNEAAAQLMDLLTVARRASLGINIRTYFSNARARLAVGASYSKLVTSSEALDLKGREFYESTYLIGLGAAAEALLSNLATEYLVCFPARLPEQTLSFPLVNETGSIATAIQALAEQAAHDWSYGAFPDFVQKTIDLFDARASLDPALLDEISEIMATRDIYVHANGIVNKDYLTRMGPLARTGLGRKLELGQAYIGKVEQALGRFIDELEKSIPQQIRTLGKASAFRAMWDATSLAKTVLFDDGWLVKSEDVVEPREDRLAANWSHTEQMLLEFFRSVSNEYHGDGRFNVTAALWRFSPASNEGKVVASWVSSPFWF